MTPLRSSPFRLGFLTHFHGNLPVRELYPALIDLFVAAEELGFETGWVAQHHLQTLQGRLPSPLVFLAAVAARTTRIRLGTALTVLPLEDPLRLAEDAAVLEAISGGRLELGLGTGGPSVEQFPAFGVDPAQRFTRYDAHKQRFLSILRGEALPGDLRLEPAAPGLAATLWEAPSREDAVRQVAADGHGLLLGIGPARSVQLPLAKAYHAAFRGTTPRIAAVRGAFPGASREERASVLWHDVKRQLPAHREAGWVSAHAGPHELLAAMNVQYGTPEDLVGSLRADPVLPLSSDLILAVQSEQTTVKEAIRNAEIIARDVAPALGWAAPQREELVHV
ncbi:LLM class flavin-dependent oxidoreductase [Deinococcus hopiensis]|uniref:Coenzyme F420-dependent N5,N10-methylene tetrahydromethanopterin reductase and related flavin-dependent oxidoreductases n=1 Tax=Deinococcus hopiensis KR-140 TaxID=695939 RepID=A0A1W1UVY4_9DEIO|nr:LLM class flavin-dependent oxidoreductase [Deinococcus hopiensis]SMB85252.1 Coenzyme F420-dependent N5,N10-methylene tetrahydromethanopterin reductase and related flavin-dependent oxidoreductases [Deinococcus hopiensis KR-140]